MPNVDIAEGITQGLANVQTYQRERPVRDARNAQAQLVQARANADLAAGVPQLEADKQVTELQNQVKSMQMQSLKQDTFSAFDRYSADGDTKHLNTFLQQAKANPAGQALYADIVRIDPVQPNQFTKAQLGQMGVDNPDEYLAHPELAKSKVIGTSTDGTQKLIDINKVYQATGYTEYMSEKQLKQLHLRAQIDATLNGPQSAESSLIGRIAKEQGISLTEAAAQFYKMKKPGGTGKGSGSAQERIAAQLMEQDPSMSWEDSLTKAKTLTTSGSALEREATRLVEEQGGNYQETYSKLKDEQSRTNKRKQLDEAKIVRSEIDKIAGGDYLTNATQDETTRRKIGPLVTELENLTGKSLSTEEKKTARELRNLFALGEQAGKGLKAEDVGFIDNTLKSVKKYFSDDATGVENTAAYSTFANVLRNTLYGASLTATEVEAFRSAAGTLKQQLGPVLAGLKVQLSTVKEQMKAISDMSDEHIAQYYLGTSLEHMDKVMTAIDDRIELFTKLQDSQVLRGTKPAEATTQQAPAEATTQQVPAEPSTPAARPSLDDIFKAK